MNTIYFDFFIVFNEAMENINDIKQKFNLNNNSLSNEELVGLCNGLINQIQHQEEALDWYQQLIRSLNNTTFAKSSERVISGQLSIDNISRLFNEVEHINVPEEEKIEVAPHTRKTKKVKGKHFVDFIDAKPDIIEQSKLDGDDLLCPCCENDLHEIRYNSIKEIISVPASFKLKEHQVFLYGCRDCEANGEEAIIVSADSPKMLIKGSCASPSLVANIANEKYEKALPLYRQEMSFKRQGITLSRQTMSNWLMNVADKYLVELHNAMVNDLKSMKYILSDETPLNVLNKQGESESVSSYMWVYTSGRSESKQMCIFQYEPDRKQERVKDFLNDYNGIIQSDGYVAYNGLETIKHAGCLAHARRKFKDHLDVISAENAKKSIANDCMKIIRELFMLERRYDDLHGEDYDSIFIERQKQSKPLIEDLYKIVEKNYSATMPPSKLKIALSYVINQKEKLCTFLEDGRIEISNNRSENKIRPFVVGRKNWLFSNTEYGATNSGIYYSIIESAKMNGLKPYDYLEYILTSLKEEEKLNEEAMSKYLPYSEELPERLYLKSKKL